MATVEFKSYCMFHALKKHFSSKTYNYFTEKGVTFHNTQSSKFDGRYDRVIYYKLWKKYKKELRNFFVSVFSSGSEFKSIGDLLDEPHHDNYMEWLRRRNILTKVFKDDVEQICFFIEERGTTFKSMLQSSESKSKNITIRKNKEFPAIMRLQSTGYISPETVIIINELTGFCESCNCTGRIWNKQKLLLMKSFDFVDVSELGKFASVLRKALDELG